MGANVSFTVSNLARQLNASFEGDGELLIEKVVAIETAGPRDITFLANMKYAHLLEHSKAGCIIVPLSFAGKLADRTIILAEDPYFMFARVMQLFYQPVHPDEGISAHCLIGKNVTIGSVPRISAFVCLADDVTIGDNVILYPGVYVGKGSSIGDGSIIYPNVTLREDVHLGRNVIVHSGTVIGSDGYGFAFHQGKHHKIPQTGNVVIEDDVELGACVTIDRAVMGTTTIGKGTKFDNQVHIAHNVSIGEHSLIIAQSGVSGSTKVGKYVTIAGQSGLVGHITIGNGVTIAAGSAVTKSIPDGKTVSGLIPAREHSKSQKAIAAMHRLPELVKRVNELEKIIKKHGLYGDSSSSDERESHEYTT